ncbi:hypothetical protein C3486_08175 [Streptomyces sp. Ru73]|uniref:SCO4983 family protein n=1 Tax=Streptomyces sp. Ru73 TaxID=2080748 RepID=UPI000CDD375B|nr:hypothetical protein [Streptomyces sp. Ru73]POX41653.1 hypothetical protein C3486_08175 [Streptomyces sp. Ru73]
MYEPIRTKSVHTMAEQDFPHRSRAEELDIRLAGHLTALLTTLDELRALTPDAALDDAADRLAEQVARLRGGDHPLRALPSGGDPERVPSLRRRVRTLAGNALVVANSRADKAAAALAAELLRLHEDERKPAAV